MGDPVQLGAGAVGRGNFPQHYSDMGYGVIFVDAVEALVNAMNARQSYTLRLVGPQREEDVVIDNVRAILPNYDDAILRAMSQAPFLSVAVPAGVLPHTAKTIADFLVSKGDSEPTNIVLALNKIGGADYFRGLIAENLPEDQRDLADNQHLGIAHTVIARMGPRMDPELLAKDPTLFITEDYYEIPIDINGWVGKHPVIPGFKWVKEFDAYDDRKVRFHNFAHAVMSYLGLRQGLEYAFQVPDAELNAMVEASLDIAQERLEALYGHVFVGDEDMTAHRKQLLARIYNQKLGDQLLRLGADPLRKLSHDDRLIPVLEWAVENVGYERSLPIIKAVAAGYYFNDHTDKSACELQQMLAKQPFADVLKKVSGIQKGTELSEYVTREYESMAA